MNVALKYTVYKCRPRTGGTHEGDVVVLAQGRAGVSCAVPVERDVAITVLVARARLRE